MSRPPFAERLLLGLLTDPALGDAILGDLTEEWRTRITRDGRMSADLWYWGQAIRTMPHLLRDWCVDATRPDVRLRLAGILVVFGIAVLPAAATHVMANMNLAVARVMLGSLSAASDGGIPLTLNWLETTAIPLAVGAICALAGAYVLGSRSRVAPLVSVFWFGAASLAPAEFIGTMIMARASNGVGFCSLTSCGYSDRRSGRGATFPPRPCSYGSNSPAT